jgi:hypothetical protein
MNSNKKTARIVGALFLIAIVASLAGGLWLETFLGAPDYQNSVSENKTQVITGVLLELVNGIAVIGIAVGLYPLFRKKFEALALGYVALRIIEAIIIIAAVISPITLIALGQGTADASNFQSSGALLLAIRSILVGQFTGIFFSLAALLLFYLLYQTKLVPRFISVWGLISVALVLAWNLIELYGITVSFGMILALPMILNEIFLAIWLIVKGFNPIPTGTEASEMDVK